MRKYVPIAKITAILLLIFSLGVAASERLEITEGSAIEAISGYIEDTTDRTTPYLRVLGFTPYVDQKLWNDFSPIRKIEAAYIAAEDAETNQGDRFLKQLSILIANDFPSVRSEPELERFFSPSDTPRAKIEYRPPARGPPQEDSPSADIMVHIAILADTIHQAAVPGLKPRLVLVHILGLSEAEAYSTLRREKSGKDAIASTFRAMANPPRNRKIAELAQEVQARSEAARVDAVLNDIVARFLYVDDPALGKWFRIRNELEARLDSGNMNAQPQKVKAMQEALAGWKRERARVGKLWSTKGASPTARVWEQAFYEYTRKSPQMSALWGFAVISLDDTLNYEKYYPELVESRLNSLVESQLEPIEKDIATRVGRSLSASERLLVKKKVEAQVGEYRQRVVEAVHEHGPIPEFGYRAYVGENGFESDHDIKAFFSSPAVSKGIEDMCPNT